MKFLIHILTALALFSWASAAAAHTGRLDKRGCHHDRSKGGYHCHEGAQAGQSFKHKDEAVKKAGEKTAKSKKTKSSAKAKTSTKTKSSTKGSKTKEARTKKGKKGAKGKKGDKK